MEEDQNRYKEKHNYENKRRASKFPDKMEWVCLTCGMVMQTCTYCWKRICSCNTEAFVGQYEYGVSCKECTKRFELKRERALAQMGE
jgi:hypothetical protein